MNAPEQIFLPDVQSSPDARRLAIQHVGVKGLRYPLAMLGGDATVQHTVATMTMTVALPPELKGTHMSRFVELLEGQRGEISAEALPGLLDEMLLRLDAERGRIEMRFPWFIRKQAPVSQVDSLLDIDVGYVVEKNAAGETAVTLEVVVPVTSLCPCSKKISDYGAHNQRSHLTLNVTLREAMAVEALVRIAEEEASCEVFGLLKRPDEKWVTERAYDNPKFVEDLVRDIALRLGNDARIARWKVASENFESIHNHSAYAELWGENV